MPARLFDGKAIAATVRREIAADVAARVAAGKARPGLVTVLVGDDPASHVYVRNKRKACDEVGFTGRTINLPGSTSQSELLVVVESLNADPAVHGILVQLPLPKQIDESAVLLAIRPEKDVDCFHPDNVGRLAAGLPRFYPCTPHGCVQILKRSGSASRALRDVSDDEEAVRVVETAGPKWGAMPAVMGFATLPFIFLGTIMGFELVRGMSGYNQPGKASGPVVKGVASMLGMTPNEKN